MQPTREIATLLTIMAALRTPGSGCPWDLDQDFASIAPYTIEEAYEVADAIDRGDMDDLKDELGDLLLQVVFHARMAQEAGAFDFGDVCAAISAKMIRRHPHVFADRSAADRAEVKRTWEAIKADEKAERRGRGAGDEAALPSRLDDVPRALPALLQAVKLQRRAASVGFDWDDPGAVRDKIVEELDELTAALADKGDSDRASEEIGEEIGDLLFAVANLARHLNVDPEQALRAGNAKFRRRFAHIERRSAEAGTELSGTGLERMERWWQEAKRAERRSQS